MAIWRHFSFFFSSFFFFLDSGPLDPFPSAPSRSFIANEGWRLHSSSPRRAAYFLQKQPRSPKRAGCFIPKLSSGPKGWKMSPKWSFCPHFEYFAHFLLKHHKTLWIARQLTLSSSIQPTRIQMLANDRPWMKLGYDNFKVTIRPITGKNFFYDSVGNPLFPLYKQ